jgi:hypothetical protein
MKDLIESRTNSDATLLTLGSPHCHWTVNIGPALAAHSKINTPLKLCLYGTKRNVPYPASRRSACRSQPLFAVPKTTRKLLQCRLVQNFWLL